MDKTVMERYTKYETETTKLVYNNTAADDQQHHFKNYQNKISTINDTEQVYFIDDKFRDILESNHISDSICEAFSDLIKYQYLL